MLDGLDRLDMSYNHQLRHLVVVVVVVVVVVAVLKSVLNSASDITFGINTLFREYRRCRRRSYGIQR